MLAKLIEWFQTRDERGQGLVEYALIIALIAVVAVAALTLLGGSVSDMLNQISCQLGNAAACP